MCYPGPGIPSSENSVRCIGSVRQSIWLVSNRPSNFDEDSFSHEMMDLPTTYSEEASQSARKLWRQWIGHSTALLGKACAGEQVIRLHMEALTGAMQAVTDWWRLALHGEGDGDPLSTGVAAAHHLHEGDWLHLAETGVLQLTCEVLAEWRVQRRCAGAGPLAMPVPLAAVGAGGHAPQVELLPLHHAVLELVDVLLLQIRQDLVPAHLQAR